ncbi:hypothetical protein M6C35_001898 [Vibrio metschnikovii]|nr:hypothetical protein [Vibrio metschnikovii]
MKKILLASLLSIIATSTLAGWPKTGHWEFETVLDEVGDVRWDKTVVFDIHNGSISQRSKLRNEIKEIGNMAGMNYREMEALLERMLTKASEQRLHDLKYFPKLSRNFNEKRYLIDTSDDEVLIFSHKLNEKIVGNTYAMYKDINSFVDIDLHIKWFDCEARHTTCQGEKASRMSKSNKDRLIGEYKKQYNLDLTKVSFVLYDYESNDFYAVQYQNKSLDNAIMYYLNLRTFKGSKPINIHEFIY